MMNDGVPFESNDEKKRNQSDSGNSSNNGSDNNSGNNSDSSSNSSGDGSGNASNNGSGGSSGGSGSGGGRSVKLKKIVWDDSANAEQTSLAPGSSELAEYAAGLTVGKLNMDSFDDMQTKTDTFNKARSIQNVNAVGSKQDLVDKSVRENNVKLADARRVAIRLNHINSAVDSATNSDRNVHRYNIQRSMLKRAELFASERAVHEDLRNYAVSSADLLRKYDMNGNGRIDGYDANYKKVGDASDHSVDDEQHDDVSFDKG